MISQLLECVRNFKTQKVEEGIDLEKVKEKYKKIKDIFRENLPQQPNENEFIHSAELFTRESVASKVKNIRSKYWLALDTGRQSGGGRAVATSFDLCSQI